MNIPIFALCPTLDWMHQESRSFMSLIFHVMHKLFMIVHTIVIWNQPPLFSLLFLLTFLCSQPFSSVFSRRNDMSSPQLIPELRGALGRTFHPCALAGGGILRGGLWHIPPHLPHTNPFLLRSGACRTGKERGSYPFAPYFSSSNPERAPKPRGDAWGGEQGRTRRSWRDC